QPRAAPKHNAHSPTSVRIHYRWHPLFGQDLKLHRTAKLPRGEYIYCDLPDGTIAGLPAWMADPTACSSIEVGKVMASAEARSELRRLMASGASHGGAPLEKMPVEAPHERQETGRADEPAALPDRAN